jgi:hypothetical protein
MEKLFAKWDENAVACRNKSPEKEYDNKCSKL